MSDTKYKKPYYGIKLDLAQVGVDIRLNDIPIYYDDQKGQLTVDLPAPTSIINGENELKLTAFTPYLNSKNKEKMNVFLPGAVASIQLYVQETDDPSNKKEILSSIFIKFNDENLVEVVDSENAQENIINYSSKDKAIVTQKVNIHNYSTRWAWQDGQTITDTKDNYNSLMLAYKEIHNALLNKDKEKVFSLYHERAREVTIAYHLNNISEGHKKINTAENINDNSLELIEFWDEGMSLKLYGNDKLASIVDADGDSPIVYYIKESELVKVQNLMFYKDSNNKWVLIR